MYLHSILSWKASDRARFSNVSLYRQSICAYIYNGWLRPKKTSRSNKARMQKTFVRPAIVAYFSRVSFSLLFPAVISRSRRKEKHSHLAVRKRVDRAHLALYLFLSRSHSPRFILLRFFSFSSSPRTARDFLTFSSRMLMFPSTPRPNRNTR